MKGLVTIFHNFNVLVFLIDTTFSSSSAYVTYVHLVAAKAKKERKGEKRRRK